MAGGKKILIHPNGTEFTFDADHADRIMAMEKNGGWILKEMKKGKNANKRRSIKAAVNKAEAKDNDCGCE